jgi:hypothetical protein
MEKNSGRQGFKIHEISKIRAAITRNIALCGQKWREIHGGY